MSGALSERTQGHFRRKTVLAVEIFNRISRRAAPNFFHMALSLKTPTRGRACTARGERHISNTFYVWDSLARIVLQKKKLDVEGPLEQGVSSLALYSPRETFASDNLACSQLSKSHGPGPKMIYTHCFLNINHRARPSCKTDVRQYDGTVVVPSRRRGYLWTWFIYLALFYVFKCCYFLWLLWFHFFFFCIDNPRASV